MNREGIRRLAAETLQLKTSPYRFAASEEEYKAAVQEVRFLNRFQSASVQKKREFLPRAPLYHHELVAERECEVHVMFARQDAQHVF